MILVRIALSHRITSVGKIKISVLLGNVTIKSTETRRNTNYCKCMHPQPGIQYIAKVGIKKHALGLSFILAACFSVFIVVVPTNVENSNFLPTLAFILFQLYHIQ